MKTLTFYRLVTQKYSYITNRAEHRKVQATEVKVFPRLVPILRI